ncbi:MAG TPA: M56 family metallopeptidase [Terriglobia bacterium]|nr:M56 family metallopeptidase [Terriglobia bacterium]
MTGIFHSLVQVTQFPSAFYGWSFTFLSEVLVKGTILVLVAFALGLVLRAASAASRHLVWTLALSALLALPVFALTLPAWEVPVPAPSSSFNGSVQVAPKRTFTANPHSRRSATTEETRQPAVPAWPSLFLFVWATGALFFLARMAVGEIRVRSLTGRSRLFRTSQALSVLEDAIRGLRISRAVELRTSAEIGIPFTRGDFRPAIFLPEEAREWTRERLEFVLAHELAHVNRHDYLTQIPAQIVCALFWFHPLVWFAAVQMRKERERACDDMVLNLGHPAADYAEFLVMLGRSLRSLTPAWSTSIAMAQSSQLEARMKALLDPMMNHKPLTANRALFAAVLTFALLVPVASIRGTVKNATGSISGTVHDPSGAVIPGAAVSLFNMKSHDKIEIGTGQDGSFTFPAIPAGRYQLEIASPGFVRKRSPVLELKPSGDLHEAITLDVGEVSQTITVTGQRPAEAIAAPRHPPKRILVGGNVQAPKVVEMAKPVYPASAKKQGIEGTVILRAVIGTSGQILSLEPYNGAHPALIKAAMDAVGRWRYQPTLLNGVPVEVATTITVVFRLDQSATQANSGGN